MTKEQLFMALAYASVAQQVELTKATVDVYFDQLQMHSIDQVNSAIRRWVSSYSEGYRRLPTVAEICSLIRSVQPFRSPDVEHVVNLGRIVRQCRLDGFSQDQIDAVIEKHDKARMCSVRGRR